MISQCTATPISQIALDAVKRIDALFDIEREINGLSAAEQVAACRERSALLVAAFESWMRAERAKLSRHAAVAKAIDYMLTRWEAFTRSHRCQPRRSPIATTVAPGSPSR